MRFFILFLLLIIICCKHKNNSRGLYPKIFAAQLDSIKNSLQQGDIVFRAGTDIESETIRKFSNVDKTFSHSGIVLKDKAGLKIYHILGGITNLDGSILYQSIDSFINYPQNIAVGIYSTNLSTLQMDSVNFFIDSVINKKIKFDLKFDLYTKDKLYCTELLVDALEYATQKKYFFNTTSYLVKNSKYQLLMNYKDSFKYYPIDQFQHSKFFTLKKQFNFPAEKD